MSTQTVMDDLRANITSPQRPGGEAPVEAMVEPPAGPDRRGGVDRAAVTAPFLSLYLLVLVFFIVLVSISAREDLKSTKVMNSVASTFAPDARSATLLADFPDAEGQEMAGHLFQKRIAKLVSERLRVAKVTVVKPGELMQVSLPADSLFHSETADIREFQDSLLDRIVAELSSRPPGLSFELELEIGSRSAIGVGLPIGATLEVNRAGAFARRMLALGAPPNAVSVALGPGDPREVKLTFLVHGRDSNRFDLVDPGSTEGARHAP